MTSTEQRLGLWLPQVTGRYLNEDWNPTNQGFGAQCWDAAANWSKYLGLPVISTGGKGRWPGWAGNMVDAFPQTAAIAAAYELISPDAAGLPGDIAVWGDGYYYYPKTHVAVLVRESGGLLLCVSQNSSASLPGNPYPQWTTGPTILQYLPRRGLIGFIRPRTTGTITTLSASITKALGERMSTLDKDDLEAIQGIVQAERATTVAEVRAHAVATVNAVSEMIESAVFNLSVFTQETDNKNTDASILDFRAQLQAGLAEIAAQHAVEPEPTEGGK